MADHQWENGNVYQPLSDRVSLQHSGGVPVWAAGAETPSRTKSFVCRTTPHYGSTSRGVSYSVRKYHTTSHGKSKYFFTDWKIIFANQPKRAIKRPRPSWSFPKDSVYNVIERRGRVSRPAGGTFIWNLLRRNAMHCQKLKTYMETGRVVLMYTLWVVGIWSSIICRDARLAKGSPPVKTKSQ